MERWALVACLVFQFSAIAACAGGKNSPQQNESSMPRPAIEEVQAKYEEEWMAIPGVHGVGIALCDDVPCLKLFAAGSSDALHRIPDSVEGYKVIVDIEEPFRARDNN